jgi:DNA ligase-1
MKLPTLYSHSKSGKVKQWDIQVAKKGAIAIIRTSAGYTDGKKQEYDVEVLEGKNLDRSNATDAWGQACFEAESKWKKQIDKGYTEIALEAVEEGEEQLEGKYPLPMLAKEYLDYLHDVEFPVLTQKKLNGIRGRSGTVDGKFVMWSRKAKLYTVMMERFEASIVPILKQLNAMYPNAHLDGEFFCHGLALQTINSGVKKANEITERIQYHIYDIAEPSLTQEEREEARIALLANLPKDGIVVCVPSIKCADDKEVQKQLKVAIDQKYEGLIVRKLKGEGSKYLNRHRSNGLLKLKKFHDGEYRIIGGKDGKGKFKGSVIFRCITDDGKEFDVNPTGTMEERRQWFNELDSFIGKQITVRYQDLSNDGIPTILTGIDAAVIRDYE